MFSAQLAEAVDRLRRGGIIAYPTEAVYGLGCHPNNAPAVRRLLAIKRRGEEHGLILIAHDFSLLAPYCKPPDAAVWRRIGRTWPGPCTWLLRASKPLPLITGGRDRIAVRVTSHPMAAALCRACGRALVSTSANTHGRPPARTATQVRAAFNAGDVDYVLPGSIGGQARPTPILDARNGRAIRAA